MCYSLVIALVKQITIVEKLILKTSIQNFGKHLLWGLLIISGGLFLYMVFVQTIGYLPYSDRPGPGWYRNEISISWDQIVYILGFISMLSIYILAELILVYGLFLLFRLIGYNRITYSILGGIIVGFLSFYSTLGIGWYIAIDLSSVIAGGILGIIYGSTLFPVFLKPDSAKKI